MIGILCILLLLSACGAQTAKEAGTSAVNNAMQDSVNLKCTVANTFTLYFLRDMIKTSSASTETWIIDGYGYTIMKIGETKYLMKTPVTQPQMDYTTMKTTYYQTKSIPGYDCEQGAVTEEDMILPDYPQLTSAEFTQKFQEEMMKQ